MRFRWTPENNARLVTAFARREPTSRQGWEELGKELGTSGKACGIQASRLGLTKQERQYQGVRDAEPLEPPPPELTPAQHAEMAEQVARLDARLHVKKLHVHVPPPIESRAPNGMLTAVLYGDSHIPFHDQRALDVVAQVIRIARPDVLAHQGDLLDCYHLSRFDKNPKRLHRLQDEIDAARQHLAAFRLLAPKARFILLGGNHEDRLRRTLWSLPPHAEALMGLEAVTEALTWPKLLGLEELGIEHYDYGDQTRAQIVEPFLPHFMLKHGTVVRKLSAYTARAELDKYNRSGASGHTHRLGAFFHRDANGNHIWVETGCTCQLNPEYAQDPDWQAGCVVMTFEPTTGAFQVELVYIHEGTAVFRGQWIDARSGK